MFRLIPIDANNNVCDGNGFHIDKEEQHASQVNVTENESPNSLNAQDIAGENSQTTELNHVAGMKITF